jgi:hypothetical protein
VRFRARGSSPGTPAIYCTKAASVPTADKASSPPVDKAYGDMSVLKNEARGGSSGPSGKTTTPMATDNAKRSSSSTASVSGAASGASDSSGAATRPASQARGSGASFALLIGAIAAAIVLPAWIWRRSHQYSRVAGQDTPGGGRKRRAASKKVVIVAEDGKEHAASLSLEGLDRVDEVREVSVWGDERASRAPSLCLMLTA